MKRYYVNNASDNHGSNFLVYDRVSNKPTGISCPTRYEAQQAANKLNAAERQTMPADPESVKVFSALFGRKYRPPTRFTPGRYYPVLKLKGDRRPVTLQECRGGAGTQTRYRIVAAKHKQMPAITLDVAAICTLVPLTVARLAIGLSDGFVQVSHGR